ncbi:MAG: septum formation initiator [Flavobacteriaceae bacterium]|nr:septum formation initiator [Flavobacteriaceae bacterium]|tara:strand:+ start:1634 stop:1951 length:318 start_codon:yes stop_codon:yes gene_type:complete
MKLLKKLIDYLKNIPGISYIFIIIVFIIWMMFLDTHSLIIHNELSNEINQLKAQKKELEKNIKGDKKILESLKNPDSLEVFGRTNYNLKKENETIYLIEYKDSLD